MNAVLAPSILSADFACLGEQVAAVERGGAAVIHVDVMDGMFVPNITMGPLVVEALRRVTDLPLDCHLMIDAPDRYVDEFHRAGADVISVHVEADRHLHRTIQHIHECGIKAGVAINPATPLSAIEPILPDVDQVIVMSVNPGFGGQRMIPAALERIRALRRRIEADGLHTRIEIDGGVTPENIEAVAAAGVDWIVAGSAVFGADDVTERTRELVGKLAALAERERVC